MFNMVQEKGETTYWLQILVLENFKNTKKLVPIRSILGTRGLGDQCLEYQFLSHFSEAPKEPEFLVKYYFKVYGGQ